MANESNKELTSVWTPANIVTCVRIVFIPVFMIVSALSHTSVAGTDWSTFDGPLAAAAFILYVILSCTDKVDGYLARSRNEITDFGKFLDPIADKLLVFSALLLFLDFGAVSVWSVFIILFRELLVSALRMVASAAGVVVAADKLGKYKTATTMVSICGYLCVFAMAGLHLGPLALTLGIYSVSRFLYAVAVVLTVISAPSTSGTAARSSFRSRSWWV